MIQDTETASLRLAGDTEEATEDRFGWRTFRPPPPLGLLFGAVYGAIAGAIIAYDITVLIRLGRIIRTRIRERRAEHAAV